MLVQRSVQNVKGGMGTLRWMDKEGNLATRPRRVDIPCTGCPRRLEVEREDKRGRERDGAETKHPLRVSSLSPERGGKGNDVARHRGSRSPGTSTSSLAVPPWPTPILSEPPCSGGPSGTRRRTVVQRAKKTVKIRACLEI